MNRICWGVAASLSLLALGCSDTPLEPAVPGWATVMLTGAHADDGAILFELHGPALDQLQPASTNHVLYERRVSGDEVRVLVIGNLAEGAVLQVMVDDVRDLAPYSATLVQAASRTDELREDVSSYTLWFAAPAR